jgi:hypothetical protein
MEFWTQAVDAAVRIFAVISVTVLSELPDEMRLIASAGLAP